MKKLIRNKLKSLFKESVGFPKILPLPKEACREEEKLKGGLADNKTLEDIASHHKVDIEHLKKQWDMGIDVEKEHTKSNLEADEIVKDHLWEDPNYYTNLAQMEKKQLNEMPYFYDVPMGDGTTKHIDMQTEKFPTESDFEQFLISLFSGEQQGKNDIKQPEMQLKDPYGFLKQLLSFQYPPDISYSVDQLLVDFTRRYRNNNGTRKVTPKTITPEDVEYFKKFITTAASKSTLKYT